MREETDTPRWAGIALTAVFVVTRYDSRFSRKSSTFSSFSASPTSSRAPRRHSSSRRRGEIYADRQRTWLYLDPQRGVIASRLERSSRWNRWLYHGFHSLDFPFLYYRRPLWDIVVILLSVGGVAISVTSALPTWRRLLRNGRSLAVRGIARSRSTERV
jgi:hypothetical protein